MSFYPSPAAAHDTFETPSLGDLARWGSLATAMLMLTYGVSRRGPQGLCVAATALPFAYRGLAGRWPPGLEMLAGGHPGRAALAELAGARGVHVRESIRLEKPIEEVYRFWRRLENLPRFMSHLERVECIDDRRSHWVARGPADLRVEWDAEIINEVENQVIGWRSLPGSDVVTAGSVNFDAVREGRRTQVSLHLQYAPPAGRLGVAVATAVGREPGQIIRENLRRLKQLLEAGEVARAQADAELRERVARMRPASEAWR
jgi:uncharacterized membrane protein